MTRLKPSSSTVASIASLGLVTLASHLRPTWESGAMSVAPFAASCRTASFTLASL